MRHLRAKLLNNATSILEAAERAAEQVRHLVSAVPGQSPLTAAQRKAVPKPRTGGEKYVHAMAALAQRNAEYCPHGVDPARMVSELDAADGYEPLITVLQVALKNLTDSQLARRGHAWHDALDIYNRMQSLARQQPELHAEVAAFEAFLATGAHGDTTPIAPTAPTAATNGNGHA